MPSGSERPVPSGRERPVPPEPERRVPPVVWAGVGLGVLALGAVLCALAGWPGLVGGAVGLAVGVGAGVAMSRPRVAAAMRTKDGGVGLAVGLLALALWFGLRSAVGEHAGAYVLVTAGAAVATDQGLTWARLRSARRAGATAR